MLQFRAPHEEEPITRIADPIPAWTGWSRKMVTIRTVSALSYTRPLSQSEYVQKMAQIQRDAVGTSDMGRKTASFWRMENLSSAFLKNARPGQSLNDADMPVAIRPIAHCGMGIAALELANFDAHRLREIIESFSDPEYRLFAYEGTGAMLALYEPDLFALMSRICASLGILPLARLTRPSDPSAFLSSFEPEIRRLISHGYGRMLYFKNHTIASAIHAVSREPYLQPGPCIQGIAFAYSMVNNGDLRRVFRAGENLRGNVAGAPFSEGLVYALEFWEWMAPGFLESLRVTGDYERGLKEAARLGVETGRARGPLAPFAVEPCKVAEAREPQKNCV